MKSTSLIARSHPLSDPIATILRTTKRKVARANVLVQFNASILFCTSSTTALAPEGRWRRFLLLLSAGLENLEVWVC
jgi:hypothetical protein